MAHFAELDSAGVVIQVVVVSNDEILDEFGVESEQRGIDFCSSLFGGRWAQTSYNGTIRKNFAGVGYNYDEIRDAFVPPKCHADAVLEETTCQWACANEDHATPKGVNE